MFDYFPRHFITTNSQLNAFCEAFKTRRLIVKICAGDSVGRRLKSASGQQLPPVSSQLPQTHELFRHVSCLNTINFCVVVVVVVNDDVDVVVGVGVGVGGVDVDVDVVDADVDVDVVDVVVVVDVDDIVVMLGMLKILFFVLQIDTSLLLK
jgi:hypothetical protein